MWLPVVMNFFPFPHWETFETSQNKRRRSGQGRNTFRKAVMFAFI